MPSVRVRGVDLHYEAFGDSGATPLLFAHGLLGSIDLTQRMFEDLEGFAAKGLHVIAYDARGHGRSGYTTRREDYSWDALAEDMHGFIEALRLAPVAVYGGSMGAGTALACALEHPNDIARLILRSPPPFGSHAMRPVRQWMGPLATLFRLVGPARTGRLVASTPGVRRDPEGAASLRALLAAQRRESIVPAIRGLLFDEQQLPTHRFGEIRQPALVLAHPGDRLHPLRSGEILHERMPHCRLAEAPAESYWRENPGALAHVVAAFVRGEEIARGLPGAKVRHTHN